MDMIFTDKNLVDQGVLQDYSFDEEFGIGEKDTNTFSCKVQQYNSVVTGKDGVEPITEDSYLYMEFTEYGGIVDRVEADGKTGVINFTGRTWHGILNDKIIVPPAGNIYRTYDGEANDVLQSIIDDIGMGDLFLVDVVDVEDRTEEKSFLIHNFQARYERAYDFIMRMLDENEGKLIMYFQNNKVHIGAVISCNYASNEEFDSSQVPYKVGKTYNNVNHMICLGAGDAEKRACIHLFVDEEVELAPASIDPVIVKPYAKVEYPKQDSDYILDTSEQDLFGVADIQYLLDSPNAEVITNYLPLTTKPNDWNGQYYLKYYYRDVDEDGNDVYTLFKQTFKDEYDLKVGKPSNWETNFQDYYYWDPDKDTQYYKWDEVTQAWAKCSDTDPDRVLKSGGFSSVKALPESQVEPEYRIINNVPDWGKNYMEYYLPIGVPEPPEYKQRYQAVQATEEVYYGAPVNGAIVKDARLTQEPVDWKKRFNTYYTWYQKDQFQRPIYISVAGVQNWGKVTKVTNKKEPTNWKQNWGNYYVKWNSKFNVKGKPKVKKGKATYITLSVAVQIGQLKKPKGKNYIPYKANTYYTIQQLEDTAPAFGSTKTYNINDHLRNGVYVKYSKTIIPTWATNTYYERIVNTVPPWREGVENQFTGYYTKSDEPVEQIPKFNADNAYYAVEDRYAMLVEEAMQKLKELRDTSTLDIDLELESNYDILDVVGSTDPVTKIEVNKPILRKIIKIKKDVLTVNYEVD